MSNLDNLEDIRDMEGFDEFNEVFQSIKDKLFAKPEKTQKDLFNEAIEKCKKLDMLDLIDEDNLNKAIKDGWKKKTGLVVKSIPDFVGIDKIEDIPDEEFDDELDLHLSIYQLGMITSILENIDSKQIANAMVKAGLFEKSPINPIKVEDLIEPLMNEITIAKDKILIKTLRKYFKEGQKIIFESI